MSHAKCPPRTGRAMAPPAAGRAASGAPLSMPSGAEVLRAGANGAAIAGTWTAIYEGVRLRGGEVSADEAIRATASSAAIGAGAGAVTHIASNLARRVPILGLAALALGVVYFTHASTRPAPAAPTGGNGGNGGKASKEAPKIEPPAA